jgi:ABC-2 type transport system ATP-binding protein
MNQPTNAIAVEGLTKRFGETTAIEDLSFTVEGGELFGLLGPNGAGKSTLINILCTLLGPTEGTARVNGHDVTEETGAVRDSLGIVFQEPAIDEELTGTENLAFHARMYGTGKAERQQRIPEVLDLVELAAVADDPVESYSDGMQRRLEIGRGLMHEPDVLFLDEPTTGLDARTRRDTWEYIERLNEESGVSIVITTHYMDEADFLCERVAVMDQGEVVAIDSPAELKASLGGDVLALGLAGGEEELFERLDAQPWVREYTATEDGVAITMARGEQRVADLVRIADDAGATIESVDLRNPSLENVFLSLTGSTLTEREASDAEGSHTEAADEGSSTDRPTETAGTTEAAEAAEATEVIE